MTAPSFEEYKAAINAATEAKIKALKIELTGWMEKKISNEGLVPAIAMLETAIVRYIEVLGDAEALEFVQTSFWRITAKGSTGGRA